jgi:hypothetical protein
LGEVRARFAEGVIVVEAPSQAPEGSVVQVALFDDEPRRRSGARAEVRQKRVRARLAVPRGLGPGLFQIVLAYEPRSQPRYVSPGPAAVYRRVPVVVGTPEQAQAARARRVEATRRVAREGLRLARELERRFGNVAGKALEREALVAWLEQRAPPLVRVLRGAIAQARDEVAATELTTRGQACLRRCDQDVRRACSALGVRPPRELLSGSEAPIDKAKGYEPLVVDLLIAQARAKRDILELEPSRRTLSRLRRRVLWLELAGRAAPDVGLPKVCRWALEDLRLGLARVAGPAAGLPRAAKASASLGQWGKRLANWVRTPLAKLKQPSTREQLLALAKTLAHLELARRVAAKARSLKDLNALYQEAPEAAPLPLLRRSFLRRLQVHQAVSPRHRACVEWLRKHVPLFAAGKTPEGPARQAWIQAFAKLQPKR